MIAGIVMVRVFYKGEPAAKPEVSVGVVEYKISGNKLVKDNTPELRSLKAFLTNEAKKDCKNMSAPSHYIVKDANSDLSQVLLGYGCGNSSAHLFAVRTGNTWKTLSPTNSFYEPYGIPGCDHVAKHDISKSLAPVCATTSKQKLHYTVR